MDMIKYKEIANELKQRILAGTYKIGEPLPDQINMAKEFNASRVTVQKALQILAVEGLVYSKQGSGTYVRRNALQLTEYDTRADEYMGSTKKFGAYSKVTSKIIKFDVRFPTDDECEKLMIEKSSPIYDIIRLRLLDDEPFALEYTYMPIEVIPNITEDILYHSIYSYIKEELKLVFGGANRRIKARKPDAYDKNFLECEEVDPVLEVEQVVYLENGIPFEYSRTRHRYDKGDIILTSIHNN